MGRHSRPGPPNRPPGDPGPINPADPLAAYLRRRRAPADLYRRHRPAGGGAWHVRPDEPRLLEEWDGFTYRPAGTAPNLAAAAAWAAARTPADTQGPPT